MIGSAMMRLRKAELQKRYSEKRDGDNSKELLGIINELSAEIAQLDSANWFVESHDINGKGCQIAEGINSYGDGPARIIGKITDQKDADEVVILRNEAALAIRLLRDDLADAAMRLNGKVEQSLIDSFDRSIANADDILSRLK